MEWIISSEWWLAKEIPHWLFFTTMFMFTGGLLFMGWIADHHK